MHSDTCSAAQNDTADFTPLLGGKQVKVQTTTKAVTPFAGLLSFFAWLRAVGLPAKIAELMPFAYRSPNAIAPAHLLLAFLTAVILGASRFAHSDWLRHDKALHTIMGIVRFPGEDAIRRFFHRFGQGDIERFWRPLWRWLLALWAQPARGFTLDLDSTIFAREGRQEGAAKGYNPRRRVISSQGT